MHVTNVAALTTAASNKPSLSLTQKSCLGASASIHAIGRIKEEPAFQNLRQVLLPLHKFSFVKIIYFTISLLSEKKQGDDLFFPENMVQIYICYQNP